MKRNVFLLMTILFISSCCKKEDNVKYNILSGKIKALKEYYNTPDSTNYLFYYNYLYDSTSGDLQKVILNTKQSGIYIRIGEISINKIDNNTVIYNDAIDKRKFKVYLSGNQIIRISEIDTVNNVETVVTNISLTNNKIDSVSDVGFSNPIFSNIQLKDFNYINNNCKKFFISWTVNFGFPIHENDTLLFSYSNLSNSTMVPNQLPYYFSGGSVMSFLSFNLSINGYYIIQPNKNLIDSINYSSKTDYFSYVLTDGKVSKITYTYNIRPDYIMYHNLEYY